MSEIVEPYNLSLNRLKMDKVRDWAQNILGQLKMFTDIHQDHFIVLAGQRYRRFLIPHLVSYEIPLEGLGIGKQLQYLNAMMRDSSLP